MHVVKAARTFFGMDTLNDTPNKNVISDAFLSSDKEKKCLFENMLKQFLEKFVFRSNESEMCESDEPSLITPTCEQADRIEAYALELHKAFPTPRGFA